MMAMAMWLIALAAWLLHGCMEDGEEAELDSEEDRKKAEAEAEAQAVASPRAQRAIRRGGD